MNGQSVEGLVVDQGQVCERFDVLAQFPGLPRRFHCFEPRGFVGEIRSNQ